MALTYGFFNSVNSDRVYNADQIGDMFEGLISGGVYESVGDAFKVSPSSGLTVSVGSGRAIVGNKWAKLDAATTLTLNAASVTQNRYTAIVLRRNATARTVTLEMIDGAPATNPTKPSITRNATTYDILLAYVRVNANATAITAANIEDTRANTSVCGFVTGLISQVDTSDLFTQYETAYDENLTALESWEASMKSQFEAWLAALTEELQVNTYIQEYKTFKAGITSDFYNSTSGNYEIAFSDIPDYSYTDGDIIDVYINGLKGIEGVNYALDTSNGVVILAIGIDGIGSDANIINTVEVRALKSIIGIQA